MDITNHTYSEIRPQDCILSYEEPASPDILIQTKKTVVYLDVFPTASSSVNTVYSDDEADSSSYDFESDEEDPLMVKPLPARGIPPAKPTILPQNYLKKTLNSKYQTHNYNRLNHISEFEVKLKRSENLNTEIEANSSYALKQMVSQSIIKSETIPLSNVTDFKTKTTFNGQNQSLNRTDIQNKDIFKDASIESENIKNSKKEEFNYNESCLTTAPPKNLKHSIEAVINNKSTNQNEELASICSSPHHSPLYLDEYLSPDSVAESDKLEKISKTLNAKKVKLKNDDLTKMKKGYTCNRPECSFLAATRKALYCHKREKHRDSRDFLCSLCPFRTYFASDLKKHIGTHIPVVMKCPYKDCNYVGKHSNSLDYHKRKVHPAGSPLHCSIPGCQYSTFLPSNLKVHEIKNHGSGKTISCDQCSYRCYLTAELRKHLRSHSSETPYACDFPSCQYACKISSNLRKHKRIHTEERPYACDICSFRSNFISSLKAHKRIHTDERPYCCEQCGYRCNSASNLKKHIVQRHPGTVYEMKKDNLKKGRKKIDHIQKMTITTQSATNTTSTGLEIERSNIYTIVQAERENLFQHKETNMMNTAKNITHTGTNMMNAATNMAATATNMTHTAANMTNTATNLTPMPILKIENKNFTTAQELLHYHRMEHRSMNS